MIDYLLLYMDARKTPTPWDNNHTLSQNPAFLAARRPSALDKPGKLWYISCHIEGVVSTKVRQINMHGRDRGLVWLRGFAESPP